MNLCQEYQLSCKADLGGINTCFHLGFEQTCCIFSFLDILVMANFSWWTRLRQDFDARGQGTFYRGSQALGGYHLAKKNIKTWKEAGCHVGNMQPFWLGDFFFIHGRTFYWASNILGTTLGARSEMNKTDKIPALMELYMRNRQRR